MTKISLATVAVVSPFRRQSPFSATVALFCDNVDRASDSTQQSTTGCNTNVLLYCIVLVLEYAVLP